jgi:site-specific DNA-methyltransferase (adenine-specific)
VLSNVIYHGNCVDLFGLIPAGSQHLVIADPPYNIGKDFGNSSDKMTYGYFKEFSQEWLAECIRVLAPAGTLMIYGLTKVNWFLWGLLRDLASDPDRQLKELVWHYTNKQVPGMKFFQPSHENIIVSCADPKRIPARLAATKIRPNSLAKKLREAQQITTNGGIT